VETVNTNLGLSPQLIKLARYVDTLTPVWKLGSLARANWTVRRRNGIVNLRIVSLIAAMFFGAAPAFAADNYQTDIGPTPKNGRQGANVQGRGTVLATLDKNTFTLQGKFSGLSSPATEARLHMGNVMGGTGPAIGALKIPQAQSGEISGTFTLTPAQVAALKAGKLYVILDSQSAPKGNLWGWFQPAHETVPEGVPQMGTWYIPNLLDDQSDGASKKNNS
jgi:hypothetical protein